jgi:hypothetical protein
MWIDKLAATLKISPRTLKLTIALLVLLYFVPELYAFTRGFFDGLS